jgi:integrase
MTREIVVNLSSNSEYWQADWKDINGKRRKKSLGPKLELSHRQARKLCQQLQNALNKKPAMASGSKAPALAFYLSSYIAGRTELKPTTRYLFELTSKYPPKPDRQWHYVTMEQLDSLLNACPNVGWKMLLALCRLAGLRRGEALELPWSSVDWSHR